jgi:hypothetical protein
MQKVNPVGRIPTEHSLQEAEMLIVNVATEGKGVSSRNAIAQVMGSYQDGSTMVQWWNSKELSGSASAAFFSVWYTPEAKMGETASLTGEMPLCEMVPRWDMIAAFVAV